jgi:hypothetical protein
MHLILATSVPLSPHPSVPEGAGDSAGSGLSVQLHRVEKDNWVYIEEFQNMPSE